jgi:protein-tyrosine phosphatase
MIHLQIAGYKPVIAHIERYHRAPNFRKLLRFVKDVEIAVQINADSVLDPTYKKVLKKLLSGKYKVILASDTHNCNDRAPKITEALNYIEENFGSDAKRQIENKTLSIFNKIVNEGNIDA